MKVPVYCFLIAFGVLHTNTVGMTSFFSVNRLRLKRRIKNDQFLIVSLLLVSHTNKSLASEKIIQISEGS